MIGVGITSIGRKEISDNCILQIQRMMPDGAKLHITRDVKGIAQAKNDCLRNLENCSDIFLFDDDIYPVIKDWHIPYIESGVKHLSYTFGREILGFTGNCKVLAKPCGCMLYIHRDCLDAVGGFDEEYTMYSGEHEDFSRRVHNAGLTPFPYMDYISSQVLFHSMDEHKEVVSSVPHRGRYIPANMKRLTQQVNSKEFKAYK